MGIRDRLGAIFAFNTIPTTVLLVLVYAAIFISVLVTDDLHPIPSDTGGLEFEQAWLDLHHISTRPHPFNSHANDLVRDFILQRLEDVTSRYSHVEVDYDIVSNASWVPNMLSTQSRAVYQEGNNILVRIKGTDTSFHESGGYLLSAHYDSVSTAPGTTDDSMGVVTLIQMVQYFAENRPRRTVVFNINNNEESGLNGAYTFLQHPWAAISDVFLNLEGAAAGGRPIMYRATNIAPLFSWTGSHVPHPHANVITADAFSRGVIRSATDYSVYEQAGLNGLDFAFYRGRSRYHTWYDSIPGMEGGKMALWAMMEATYGASLALANDDTSHARPLPRQDKPVYFELFGSALVVFSLETLFIVNVILLSTGPILLLLLAYSKHIVRLSRIIQSRHSTHSFGNGIHALEDLSYGERVLATLKKFGFQFWSSTKFWVALAVSIGLQVALIAGYVRLNPYVIHSHPLLVFVSALSLAYLSTVLVVSFPYNACGDILALEQQKLSILFQVYGFTWVLLVFSTIVLRSAEIGGTYFITAWNICALLGCIIGLIEAMTRGPGFELETEVNASGTQYQAIGTEEPNQQQPSSRIVEESEPTETTPLVPRERANASLPSLNNNQGTIGWWILQLFLVVPFPVILVSHISVMFLGAMNQTLTDGNSPASSTFTSSTSAGPFTDDNYLNASAYSALFLLALLLVLPVSPFSANIHRWLTLLVLVVFVLSTAYAWVAFPFSQLSPMKIYFEQTVDLNPSGTEVERITTALTGPEQWLTSHILPVLPSTSGKFVECHNDNGHVGLQTCTWPVDSEMEPSPGGKRAAGHSTEMAPWVSYSLNRTGPTSVLITVQGLNTRLCTLDFTNRRISKFSVTGDSDKGLQKGYEVPKTGLNSIQLWSRTFGKRFNVSVEWEREGGEDMENRLEGRVTCGWDEYERATIGGGRSGGKIPSLEEVMQFLPEWAVVSKKTYGLFSAGNVYSI